MKTSRITTERVGGFFLGPDGDVWRLISYAEQPTATFERVAPTAGDLGQRDYHERKTGVVGSRALKGFILLVAEEE